MIVAPILQVGLAVTVIVLVELAKGQKWLQQGVWMIPAGVVIAVLGFVLATCLAKGPATVSLVVNAVLQGAMIGFAAGGLRRAFDKLKGKK